ncbi:MAG: hypothetical protein Q7R70_01740 [Candidatus Diapherotrites archaeon]|nr:hypothetical protein [Candidatus Diapherotrites archaeon]
MTAKAGKCLALENWRQSLIFGQRKVGKLLHSQDLPEEFKMQINELRPFAKKVDVVVKAVGKNEVREVSSKLDNSTHKVTEAKVGDASGTILLTLWDDMIDKVEEGKTYKISNGYTSLFQNKLRLNIGRYGTLEDSTEEITVDETNDMSEKEFERRPRFEGGGNRGGGGFNRGGGGGRFGGGGGGRSGGGGYGNRSGGGFNKRRNENQGQDFDSGSDSGEGY